MNAAKILGKIIGKTLAIAVFVIFGPIIILAVVVYGIIVVIKAIAAAAGNPLPAGETKGRIMLDRVRHLGVTQYSFDRAEKEFEKTTQQFVEWMNKQGPESAESLGTKLWFFLVDDDHSLTPQKVGRIMNEHLAGAWTLFRLWRFKRTYNRYVGTLKEFKREFGGAK